MVRRESVEFWCVVIDLVFPMKSIGIPNVIFNETYCHSKHLKCVLPLGIVYPRWFWENVGSKRCMGFFSLMVLFCTDYRRNPVLLLYWEGISVPFLGMGAGVGNVTDAHSR